MRRRFFVYRCVLKFLSILSFLSMTAVTKCQLSLRPSGRRRQTLTCWEKIGWLFSSCRNSVVSFLIGSMCWDAAVQSESSCSRRSNFKLHWSLITWTKKKTFWRKVLWSDETLGCLVTKQKYVWRLGGVTFNPKNIFHSVRHSKNDSCVNEGTQACCDTHDLYMCRRALKPL